MKYTNLRAFEKHLESSFPHHFANLYLIIAHDRFERKVAVDSLLSFLLKNEKFPEICVKSLDAESSTIQDVTNALHSLTFFSKANVVIIQNTEKLKTGVKEYLENILATCKAILVLTSQTMNSTTQFYKNVEKVGVVLHLPKDEKPWEKEKLRLEWLTRELSKVAKTIDRRASQLLLQQVGMDLAALHQELEKLVCYTGDRQQITSSDVTAICIHTSQQTIWQLGEAIFRRDSASALRISKDLLKGDMPLIVLLRSIRSQLQTELQVGTILESGGNEQDVTARFPYIKGAIFQKHLHTIQSYGMIALAKALISVDTAETQAKNSSVHEEILAEHLILKLL